MKNRIIILSLLLLATQLILAQQRPDFYSNSLTINGYPLYHDTLSLDSQGVLAIVDGDPASQRHKPVSFRAWLRRAGVIVRQGASSETRVVYSVQLNELLSFARFGDELIVEPAQPSNQRGRRVFKLRSFNWLVNWLTMNDKC